MQHVANGFRSACRQTQCSAIPDNSLAVWLALAYAVVLGFLGISNPGTFGTDQVIDIALVIAVLGLLYVGMSFVSRRPLFGYIAVSLLLSSWALILIDQSIELVQVYAIPAGLYLFAIAFFERRRGARKSLVLALESAAMSILVVSSLAQSILETTGWPYALLLAIESIFLVYWGTANRSRTILFGGVIAFVVNALWQTGGVMGQLSGAVVGLTLGLTLVILVAGLEWRREKLIAAGRVWNRELRAWDW